MKRVSAIRNTHAPFLLSIIDIDVQHGERMFVFTTDGELQNGK